MKAGAAHAPFSSKKRGSKKAHGHGSKRMHKTGTAGTDGLSVPPATPRTKAKGKHKAKQMATAGTIGPSADSWHVGTGNFEESGLVNGVEGVRKVDCQSS